MLFLLPRFTILFLSLEASWTRTVDSRMRQEFCDCAVTTSQVLTYFSTLLYPPSASGSNWTWTLGLRTMSWVFFYYATAPLIPLAAIWLNLLASGRWAERSSTMLPLLVEFYHTFITLVLSLCQWQQMDLVRPSTFCASGRNWTKASGWWGNYWPSVTILKDWPGIAQYLVLLVWAVIGLQEVYHLPDECLLFGKLFRIIPLFCRGAVGLKNKQKKTIKVKLCHLITA